MDFAIKMAIILLSPLILVESLNPEMLRYRRFEAYVERVLTRLEYSGHSPSIALHGMVKDRVPMLISLLISSYFSIWLGMDILFQNLSAVSTNCMRLLVDPNLHLSLNVKYSQIFSKISLGSCSIVAVWIEGIRESGFLLFDNRPFSG